MNDYTAATYGDRIAEHYDRMHSAGAATQPTVNDASHAMVAKLRAKPGGAAIPVTIGDFAAFQADGTFNLIFVVFNTFFGLVTQETQVQCSATLLPI